jgi:glycosyltransferase involved in cell wall biosynthesis
VPALFGSGGGIFGGAERFAYELARHMALERSTTLVTFGESTRVQMADSLTIRVVGKPWYVRGQRTNPVSLALLKELRRARVIHCHQQHVVTSSVAALYGRYTDRRVFVTDLGGGGWDVSNYVSTDRWYTAHLHISEYSRHVAGHTNKPWARVILGAVDTNQFSPPTVIAPRRSVVYVGRLIPHKGVNYLVEGMPPDIPLEIIGQVHDQRYLEELRELARGKKVTFRHDCTDEDLVHAYRRALCVVLPSVYRTMYGLTTKVPELLGQTLLEGMACGAPAICTNVASMPEVVQEGMTGFVVPPNDPHALREKILWLRSHPDRGASMGRAAREDVLQRFTWPAVVRRCLEAYGA